MPVDRPSPSSAGSSRPDDRSADQEGDEQAYTLDDLTAITGLTVRTVRYYISEGLLPPPHGAGPGTRYTLRHLDRLRLIGALKDAYLPLKEIRHRIATMTDAEIHEAVERLAVRSGEGTDGDENGDGDAVASTMLMAPPPAEESRSSAASYIEAVLQNESEFAARAGSGTRRAARLPQAPRAPMRFPGREDPTQQPGAEPAQWRRLPISPEAELLVEESTYQRRKDQIEALVAWARRILASS